MDLYIKAIEGKDLPAKDLNGKSDPFIIFQLDENIQKTQIQEKTLNPVWNEEFVFPDAKPTSTLKIKVYDYDKIGKDDKISKSEFVVASLPPGQVLDRWFKFATNGTDDTGLIHLVIHYCIKGYPPYESLHIEDIPKEYRRIPPPPLPFEPPYRDFPPIKEKPPVYPGVKITHYDVREFIKQNRLPCIQYWFEQECNMDQRQLQMKLDELDNTPLGYAALYCKPDIVLYFIKMGAPNLINNCGYTPLHYAAQNNIEITKAICAYTHGADLETLNNFFETPLIIACLNNLTDTVTFLLSQGANPNHITANGNTALLYAVSKSNINCAQVLLQAGAAQTINSLNIDKETPLIWAVKLNNPQLVELLLQHGADVNLQFTMKRVKTPLHYAATQGNMEIVQMLVAAGGNPLLPDDKGKTAIDLAKKKWHKDIANYLKSVQK